MGTNQPVSDEELLRLLKRAAGDLGVRAWVVGGYVRDKLLGLPHPNPDVVVEGGDAVKLAKRFAELAHAGPPVTFARGATGSSERCGPAGLTCHPSSRAPGSRRPSCEA